ncbi:MAG: hypothetical protein WC413_00730 [Candidatus Nanoarchaeia archaeon]
MKPILTPEQRNNIIQIGNNLAEYLYKNEIKNVVFVDRSARQGWIALKKSWEKKFPNIDSPKMYFINPRRCASHERIEEIVEEFNINYKRLSSDKNSKIMVFDVCFHTGKMLTDVVNILKKVGYTKIFTGLAQRKDKTFHKSKDYPINFIALDKWLNNCYPFGGGGSGVKKTYDYLVSLRQSDPNLKEYPLHLRKEISSLFE